jgi:hypothetical protein
MSPTPAPTSTSTSALPRTAEPLWERVNDQEAFADSTMLAVAGGPDRYVAVGAVGLAAHPPPGMAWVSTDGVTWHRASEPWADGRAMSVINDRIGYVAWGLRYRDAGFAAAVWVSPDGASWSPAADFPSSGDVEIAGIARLGDDLVALGSDLRAWTSGDGLAWQPVTTVASIPDQTFVAGVTSADDALIAWGYTHDGDAYRPITLRTTDGQRWEVGGFERGSDGFMSEAILDVIAADGLVVAVGHGLTGEAGSPPPPTAAWISADGLAWSPALLRPTGSSGALGQLAWDGARFVALGTVEAASISWWSADGLTWAEGASVPDTARDGEEVGCTGGPCPRTLVTDLAVGPAGPIAVGETTASASEPRAVVWIASPNGD